MRSNLPDAGVETLRTAPRPPALTESQEPCHGVDHTQPYVFIEEFCFARKIAKIFAQDLGWENVCLSGRLDIFCANKTNCLNFRQPLFAVQRAECLRSSHNRGISGDRLNRVTVKVREFNRSPRGFDDSP
jgi:hypothetical protein